MCMKFCASLIPTVISICSWAFKVVLAIVFVVGGMRELDSLQIMENMVIVCVYVCVLDRIINSFAIDCTLK